MIPAALTLYLKPRLLAILALGFASGLPLALTASTLSIWLTEAGVSKAAIGLFAAVATPYTLKFLWAPLIDGLRIPLFTRLLGRRRGWLIALQLLLIVAILLQGLADPGVNPWMTALAAVIVAFFSASQDVVIDAYRVELLTPEEQGAGAAMIVLGYRLGMIASSAGALYLAAYFGWFAAYAVMAALLTVGMLAALYAGEPQTHATTAAPEGGVLIHRMAHFFATYVIAPFREFAQRPAWVWILLFILFYKFADAFLGVMTNPFLIEIGFSKEQIASIVKLYGLIATIAGSFLGGALVFRLGLIKSLWLGGILHGVTNLLFLWQAKAGADAGVLAAVITVENFSGGLGTAAFVAYLSQLCHARFTATQYALLSSLAAFARTWLSTPAGAVAEALGWEGFFIFSALLALPGLLLLAKLQRLQD